MRRRFQVAFLFAVIAVLVSAAVNVQAIAVRNDRQEQSRQVSAARLAIETLFASMVNDQNDVQAFLSTGHDEYLDSALTPDDREMAMAVALIAQLAYHPAALAALGSVSVAADRWKSLALGQVSEVRVSGGGTASPAVLAEFESLFDDVVVQIEALQQATAVALEETRVSVDAATSRVTRTLFASLALAGLLLGVLLLLVQRWVLAPLTKISEAVRAVSDGVLDTTIPVVGPSELAGLGADVDAMRVQILAESADLQAVNDLQSRTNADLLAANEELEAFNLTVSHDLRAPLRGIHGYSRILLENHRDELDPQAVHYLDRMIGNATRMTQLIDDLLAFSKLRRSSLSKTRTPLADVVQDAWTELGPVRVDSQVGLEVADLPTLPVDPRLLKQVFVNLLGNAVKFSAGQERPLIDITVAVDPAGSGQPVIAVRDNGIGFPQDRADRLFAVFQRLHSESDFEGTGIGLSIVERIVHRHGGRVWAGSEPGRGATFSFTLGPDTHPDTHPDPPLGAPPGASLDAAGGVQIAGPAPERSQDRVRL